MESNHTLIGIIWISVGIAVGWSGNIEIGSDGFLCALIATIVLY